MMEIRWKDRDVKIVAASLAHLEAFEQMLDEYASFAESYSLYSGKVNDWWHSAAEFVSFWQRLSVSALPELHLVQTDSFWLIDGSELLGDVRFRHKLNEQLERNGGHIGYCVRPSARNKGLATILLKFALNHAQALGNKKALVTCKQNNLASIRVIEKNGGILTDQCVLPDGALNNRYWIDLEFEKAR